MQKSSLNLVFKLRMWLTRTQFLSSLFYDSGTHERFPQIPWVNSKSGGSYLWVRDWNVVKLYNSQETFFWLGTFFSELFFSVSVLWRYLEKK